MLEHGGLPFPMALLEKRVLRIDQNVPVSRLARSWFPRTIILKP